jgi:hypothetical protein
VFVSSTNEPVFQVTSAASSHFGLMQIANSVTGDAVGYGVGGGTDGQIYIRASTNIASTGSAMTVTDKAGSNTLFQVTGGESFIAGNQTGLSTSATEGFLYLPTSAGAPSGTPTSRNNDMPFEYDTTDHKLYFYEGGGWHYILRTS